MVLVRSEDWDIVQEICAGDVEQFRWVIERHQEQVARLMWRFSRDPGIHEELVQDVWVEAYGHLSSYRGRAPLAHWLSRITLRVGYRFWRQQARHRHPQSLASDQWEQLTAKSGEMEVLEAAELIYHVFGLLTPRDRLVLTLRYLEQWDVSQTAQYLGWSRALVRVQTLRAKQRLQKILQERGCSWT